MIFDEEDERSKRLHFGGMNLNLNSQNSPSSEQIGEVNWQIFWTECHQMNHPILPILKYLKSTQNQGRAMSHFQLDGIPHIQPLPFNATQPYLCYYIFFKEKLKSWLFTQVTRRFCEGFCILIFW